MSFSRVAIVNRGEAAMRLIHAVREINAAGAGPIETVALHTTGEANAMFVREADLSYDLGLLRRGPTSTSVCSRGPCWTRKPTPCGPGGASSRRTRPSSTCATSSA